MAMIYLTPPGMGSMPSVALSSSESRTGSTGSPFRNLGEEGRAGPQSKDSRGGKCAAQADAGLLGFVTASRVGVFGADEQRCSACS